MKEKHLFIIFFLLLSSFVVIHNAFCSEPPRYELKSTVDIDNKKIIATQKTVFTNNSQKPIEELFFHIYPHRKYTNKEKDFMGRYAGYFKINPFPEGFQSGNLEIKSVMHNGKELSFQITGEDQTLLKILLDQPLNPFQRVEISLDFVVNIPHAYGRFGWHNNTLALSHWYPILSVLNENGWNNHPFYPFHRPFFSDASFYSVELTIPCEQVVIHSGELIKETVNDKQTRTLYIETPLPVREFSLAMSPDYEICEGSFNEVKIKSFYLPGDQSYGEKALQNAKELMQYYTRRFGPYPYKEFSIAPVHLGYGGEQMANMVFIDTRVYQLPELLIRHFDFLIAHETGHQWFYNLVGIDEFTQMWLEEGINSFFLLEYLENKYGKEASVLQLPKYLEWFIPNFSFRAGRETRYKMITRTDWDRPIMGKLSGFREPSSIFSLTYGKGSGVVSMLHYLIGDDAFDRIFTRVFKEFQFQNFNLREFINICEEESSQELDWFFDQWLNTAKRCDYAINQVRGHKIFLENRGDIVMPIDIKAEFINGDEKIISWDGKGQYKELELDERRTIKKVILDQRHKLLDVDRTNNHWPRKVRFKGVPLYFGLYEIPVFLPDDSYNLVLGPEMAGSGIGVKASLQKPYEHTFYMASDYEFGEGLHKSRMGYLLKNLFTSPATVGVELFNINDTDSDEEDLEGGKVFLRRELWPAQYGLMDINDHISFYLLRNRSLKGTLTSGGLEDSRNSTYLKKDEAIVGAVLHLGRSGTYPDPSQGYKLDALLESAGHFLGATQYFYRSSIDWAMYHPVTTKTKLALRLKYGLGYPRDKSLYELGGINGLRGFDRKTIRGSNTYLASLEYRFPLLEGLNYRIADNILGLESIGGVIFFDAGQSWFEDFGDSRFKKDAGFGLRTTVNIGSFLEKIVVRVDIAQAIHESKQDPRFWFGINHAF